MNKIKLISPKLNFKDQIEEYKKEFLLNSDSMDGCDGLGNIESFEDWNENYSFTKWSIRK